MKGLHQVTVEVTWTGSYTVEGYGLTYGGGALSATAESTLAYEVIEIVGVLDDPEAAD